MWSRKRLQKAKVTAMRGAKASRSTDGPSVETGRSSKDADCSHRSEEEPGDYTSTEEELDGVAST